MEVVSWGVPRRMSPRVGPVDRVILGVAFRRLLYWVPWRVLLEGVPFRGPLEVSTVWIPYRGFPGMGIPLGVPRGAPEVP